MRPRLPGLVSPERLALISLLPVLVAVTLANDGWAQQPGSELPEGLSALPVLIEEPVATYPPDALEAEVQADVLVQIEISAEGFVDSAIPVSVILYRFDEEGQLGEEQVTPEADPYGFADLAADAVFGFVFEPARDTEGNPVPVALVWRYGFYFEEVEEEVEPLDEEGADAMAQAGNLRGELRERGTRTPLGGAEVVARQGDVEYVTVTDADGVFEIARLPAGEWQVRIAPDGYEAAESTEEVVAGQRTQVSYYLERESYGEYTYEVRSSAVRREVSRQTLTVTEITRIPGNNGDAVKVIQNLPGFARAPFNGGLIVIRGSAPEDSRVYADGVWIPLVFHFGGLTSVIASELLEEVEFIPGAFSVEYGRSTGGVINVETRSPRTDRYHGSIDIDVFDTGITVEGPIADEWSFFAAGRRSYIDAILPVVIPDDAPIRLTVAPRYWDYQAKLQWDPDPDNSASLFFFGSDDAISFVLEEPPSDPSVRGSVETSTSFHLGRLAWESEITDRLSNRAAVSFGFQDLSFTAGDLRFLLDYFPLQFNEQLEIRPVESLRLRPGLDILWATYDISAAVPRPSKEGEFPVVPGAVDILESEIENETQYQPAAYFEAEWDATEALTLVPGVRVEYYDVPGVWAFDGRLSSRYALSERLALKGAVGTFHNAPLPDEVIEPFGNPDLGLEWAIHYVLGLEYAFNDYLDLDFQVYFKDMLDLVTRSDAVVERDGEQVPEIYNNEGEGRVYGAEILFRHQLANNFFGWIAYSISRSERRDDAGEDYRLFSWDQTHVLSVLGSYELGGGWTVGARFRFVTGNPETPVEGSVYDADNDVYVRIPGDPRSVRLDPFHQLDVRVDKRFVFDAWLLDIYLDVSNVYNRGNPETIEYNFDYSESQPVSGLPIIPSIGVRGEF